MVNDYFYLEPPDNEADAVYRCEYCDVPIYEGEEYFEIDGDILCEDCVRFLYSKTAQTPPNSKNSYLRWKIK